jgi:glycine/D-amino acid oxidase-like deaminating enzyme
MVVSRDDPIAIIGAGSFGLSTALELSNQGYSNVIVFEKDEDIPSRWSAANDLNKIMRAEYEDEFYTDLAVVCTLIAAELAAGRLTKFHRRRQMPGKLPYMRPISIVLGTSIARLPTRHRRASTQ